MRRRMRKPQRLKVRRYAALLIDINEYLASFPRLKLTDKIGMTDLNEILLDIMPNSWINQSYVQVFDCEYINFKESVNMFEKIETEESIY